MRYRKQFQNANSIIAIITLNIDGINIPTKRAETTKLFKKRKIYLSAFYKRNTLHSKM